MNLWGMGTNKGQLVQRKWVSLYMFKFVSKNITGRVHSYWCMRIIVVMNPSSPMIGLLQHGTLPFLQHDTIMDGIYNTYITLVGK